MLRSLAPLLLLLAGRGIALGVGFETVKQPVDPIGDPSERLLAAADGSFYGTDTGGEFNRGSIFRLRPDGGGGFVHERLYSFHGPDGVRPLGVTPGPDSRLYGSTFYGGAYGGGTAFVFDPASGELRRLHNFVGNPTRLTLASDGQFYGVTTYGGTDDQGTLFRMSPSGEVTPLHEFEPPEGSQPKGPLLQASDGFLYGTTETTIYRADLAGAVTTIHTFAAGEARAPLGDLLEATDGNLYGVSTYGGSADFGTVFRCDKSGGGFVVLFNFFDRFDGWFPNGGLLADGGSFLGTASGGSLDWGIVYRITPDGTKTNVHEFSAAEPWYGLAPTSSGDALGVTRHLPGGGTAFLLDLPAGDVVDLGALSRPRSASAPSGEIVETSDGALWGTAGGGTSGLGTVFRLTGGDFVVHEFSGADGSFPGNLLAASDNNLYGVTASGGANGSGTIFRLDGSGTLTTLHDFGGADGADPEGGLVEATDGNFYGTTAFGGVNGGGTLFRITPAGVHTKLHDFLAQAIPEEPRGRLFQASDGYLYGTGYGFSGILFRSDLTGNVETIYDFHSLFASNGGNPPAGVIEANDGKLYGTCQYGGDASLGTIFRFEPPDTYAVVHTFSGLGNPSTNVIQASDGRLYGMTTEDPHNPVSFTSIFSVDPSGADYQTLYTFGVYGVVPAANFFQASDEMIYGAVRNYGPNGLIFRLDLVGGRTPSITSVAPDSGTAAGGLAIAILGDHLGSVATGTLGKVAFDSLSAFDVRTLFAVAPPLIPGTLNAVTVTDSDQGTATLPGAFFADFLDAPGDGAFHDQIEIIFRDGLTAGCGAGMYCRDSAVTRGQMAVFLLKAKHGTGYAPPACTGVFSDVPCPSMFADWIEQLVAEGIAAGCGGGDYCPDDGVRRDQAAAFLLLTEHGAGYVPPACQGVFPDVPCPSMFADWVEQLVAEDISAGCGAGHYCPDHSSTRGQMAAFLVNTFPAP